MSFAGIFFIIIIIIIIILKEKLLKSKKIMLSALLFPLLDKKQGIPTGMPCFFQPAAIYPPGPLPAKYFRRIRA